MAKLKRPDLERFWRQVNKDGDCWLWMASRRSTGYGQFRAERRAYLAHRLAYELSIGPIPKGMWVLHTCDVKYCVNPKHLYLGTIVDNGRDASERDRVHFGSAVFGAKLDDVSIRAIRTARAQGTTLRVLADRYGVTEANISSIALRKTWRRVT